MSLAWGNPEIHTEAFRTVPAVPADYRAALVFVTYVDRFVEHVTRICDAIGAPKQCCPAESSNLAKGVVAK